jgi:hypothetical protein
LIQEAPQIDYMPLKQERATQVGMHKAALDREYKMVARSLRRIAALHGYTIVDERGYQLLAMYAVSKRAAMEGSECDAEYGANYGETHDPFMGAETEQAQSEFAAFVAEQGQSLADGVVRRLVYILRMWWQPQSRQTG